MSATATPASSGLKLGADRKKVAILVVCLVVAGFLWWKNSRESEPSSPSVPATSRVVRQPLPVGELASPSASSKPSRRGERNQERNTLEMRPIDATQGNIDPTLRLELLERLGSVKLSGAGRSLFEAGMAPVVPQQLGGRGPIIIPGRGGKGQPSVTPPTPTPAVMTPPAQPPVIPIPLKFYGFIRPTTPGETKRGFFLDGELIVVASEGDVIKPHYRVIKLQDHSAVMEDTSNKNQQTLVLTPEARGEQ